MTVRLVWAEATGGVLGRDGGLPWHLPEDLRHFRELTSGSTVLMGRRTWDSLPDRVRPLPDRRNAVLTRDPAWAAPGAEVVHSVTEALTLGDLWVIGGASVYRAFLPYAVEIVRTEIDAEVAGDVFAPDLDGSWQAAGPAPDWSVAASGLRHRVVRLARAGGRAAGTGTLGA